MGKLTAVDALPAELTGKYLKLMQDKGSFWGDMMKLSLDFGLRNTEARTLKAIEINQDAQTITLSNAKQTKAHITKQANKAVNDLWITQAQMMLYDVAIERLDQVRAITADLLENELSLAKLAIKLNVADEYAKAKISHHIANIEQQRVIASKTAPKGRVIDYGRYPEAKKIISSRMAKCEQTGSEYLFPCNELKGSRAQSKGFEPATRQAVYRLVESVKAQLMGAGKRFTDALKGVRIGLHSLRKLAVQKVANAIDLQAASLWIGHSDISVTQAYLNKSVRRMQEIADQLATMQDDVLTC